MVVDHTVLITAAGGHIGSELVTQLLSTNKAKLVLPTSNGSRLQAKLPSSATTSNVAIEEGSISDPQWIQSILTKHNVASVFLCLTGTDELMTTLNIFDAMKRAACVKHLFYLSACGDVQSPEGVVNVMRTHGAMHVLVKTTIEQKIAYGELPWTTTILGPTLFFSNDERSKGPMMKEGIFNEPLGELGVSRVATSDIALGVCNATLNPEKWVGKKIMIGSKERFTGQQIAELWSEATGKQIKMYNDEKTLQAFEDHCGTMMRDKAWGRDLRLMYQTFFDTGFGMSDAEYEQQVELLGKEPEDYAAWVKKTGESWR